MLIEFNSSNIRILKYRDIRRKMSDIVRTLYLYCEYDALERFEVVKEEKEGKKGAIEN